jgi:Low-density lipoprotein receptor domain class A
MIRSKFQMQCLVGIFDIRALANDQHSTLAHLIRKLAKTIVEEQKCLVYGAFVFCVVKLWEFNCYNTGQCIPLTWTCDEYMDCMHGEDENELMCNC